MLFQLDIMCLELFSEIVWSVFISEELNSTCGFKSYWSMKFCKEMTCTAWNKQDIWVGILHTQMALHLCVYQNPKPHIQHQYLTWHHLALDSLCAKQLKWQCCFECGSWLPSLLLVRSVGRNFAITQRDSQVDKRALMIIYSHETLDVVTALADSG